MRKISRTVLPSEIDEDWCFAWFDQREREENWGNTLTDSDYTKFDPKDAPKAFEAIDAVLERFRDDSGIPLSRVTREDILCGRRGQCP